MSTRSKAPAFQWYPGDHRRDTGVQACSFEARALWREMLDLMHDGEPRGYLTAGGAPIDEGALARIVGISVARVRRYLAELEERRVFSRTEDGVIYSRRMVKDERVSRARANAGQKGGNPLLNAPPDPAAAVKAADKRPDIRLLKQNDKQNPTPAVAVASAEELPTTAAAARASLVERLPAAYEPDLDGLLARLPVETHTSWLRSLVALVEGMSPLGGGLPNAVPPDALGEAVRQFNANGEANWKRFRGYVRDVLRPHEDVPAAGGGGGSGAPRGPQRATAEDFARIAAGGDA